MSNDKEHKTGANKKNDDTQQAVSARLDPKVVSSRLTPNPLSEFSMDKDELRLAIQCL